ncbi:energy transducer TonB [Rhodobacteraceae bacterium KMM 6894]|nr:energy transducer TonB [Rhodobacteraceae bacterium KMM 6894]
MIKRSFLVAIAAVVLSLLLHGLGLNFTTLKNQTSSSVDSPPEMTDVGGGFEDLAQPTPEAPPPEVTQPDPVLDDIPTPEALVASDTPQDVTTPDTGDAEVTGPDAADETESAPPAPEETLQQGAPEEISAEVIASQPVETDTILEGPEGTPDGSAEVTEVQPNETAPAPTPTPTPTSPVELEVLQPEQPNITVAATPDDPDLLAADDSPNISNSAVTRSLRPPKDRPSAEALGVPKRSQQGTAQNGRPAGVIESPLTAYRRSGADPFAAGRNGGRSGLEGFSRSRAAGNATTTNYVGRVLVQLNRAPIVYASAKGTAQVQFEINPDGTIAWLRILQSTGSADIKRAASAQVRRAAPFPRTPNGARQRLAFVYRNK